MLRLICHVFAMFILKRADFQTKGFSDIKSCSLNAPLVSVSLHDSLEDTGEEDRKKNAAGSLDRGTKHLQQVKERQS